MKEKDCLIETLIGASRKMLSVSRDVHANIDLCECDTMGQCFQSKAQEKLEKALSDLKRYEEVQAEDLPNEVL